MVSYKRLSLSLHVKQNAKEIQKTKKTKLMKNKIALIFDFDITLSPYYQQRKIIEHWGIDEQKFWKQCTNKVQKEDYDLEHGYIKVLLEHIESGEYKLSNEDLFILGQKIELYEGLSRKNNNSIFDELTAITKQEQYSEQNIEIECYCISGGLERMIAGALQAHKLDNHFKKIYACRLDEDRNRNISYVKETVGHTIKTQKIYQIAKGLEKDVNEVVTNYAIPFENMIFIGDGLTDIPAFSLINSMGGTSIAVYRESKNSNGTINQEKTLKDYEAGYKLAVESQRAKQLLPADYSSGKPLNLALKNYVKELCERVKSDTICNT